MDRHSDWRLVFAWLPVRTNQGNTIWMGPVYRRWQEYILHDWEYCNVEVLEASRKSHDKAMNP